MITTIPESQNNLYNDLFNDLRNILNANKAPGAEDIGYITSLDEYFSYLDDLLANDNIAEQDKNRYLILPLDEELFFIDANTRLITVPNKFKNGVGVMGDHLAEFLIFAIDRYFDNTDLSTRTIRIEYITADGEKHIDDEAEAEEEGKKSNIIRFLDDRYPGKLTFAWPLNNLLTKEPGKVEFAVRFYKEQSQEVLFSFSSLPTKIIINKTLNFNKNDKNIKVDKSFSDEIRERFNYAGGGNNNTQANRPMWLKPYIPESGRYDKGYELKAEAGTSDTGIISYEMYKYENEKWILQSPAEGKTFEVYEEIINPTYVQNKDYYTFNASLGKYEPYNGVIPHPEELPLFERVFVYPLNEYGIYMVSAINKVGAHTRDISVDNIRVLERPTMPTYIVPQNVFGFNGVDNVMLTINQIQAESQGEFTYTLLKDKELVKENQPIANNSLAYPVAASGIYEIKINNTLNEETESTDNIEFTVITKPTLSFVKVNNGTALQVVLGNTNKNYNYKYQWYKVAADYSSRTLIEGANSNTSPAEVGVYQADIIVEYNNKSITFEYNDYGTLSPSVN